MSMKLVFPDSDRAQMLLDQRHYTIGSDVGADLVLADGNVAPIHCELAVTAQGVQLRIPGSNLVVVNDRPVTGLIALRSGDTLVCGSARIRLVRLAGVTSEADSLSPTHGAGEPVQATMVRPVLPKFVLRGMSGDQFGRSHPLQASMLVGRAEDASLRLPLEGISRQHARLTPAGDAVLVEDLGSANGTWINGNRVSSGQARHGDEIRFDQQRFQLVIPGQVVVPVQTQRTGSGQRRMLLAVGGAAAASVLAWVLLRG